VNYPDAFFGIGPRSLKSDREDFTRRFVEASVSVELATLGGRLRVGPRVAGRGEAIEDLAPGGRLVTSGLERVSGWSGLGAGGSVTWDTRDSPLWPQAGAFAQAYYLRYLAGVGHNDGFGKGAVDLRSFHALGGGRVLALGAVLETTDGATPFSLLSKLGNVRFLRGYREGRYRDAMVWAAQAELRLPIHGPLAGTVFGGAGDVFHDFQTFSLDRPKLAGGAGLRWRLTAGGANLRADAALGSEGFQFYVVLLEAF
jgi:outer membrane protein assembly factor BamA